jgi:hypothetical protein
MTSFINKCYRPHLAANGVWGIEWGPDRIFAATTAGTKRQARRLAAQWNAEIARAEARLAFPPRA